MITEQQYNDWLSADDAEPIILIEAAHSGGTVYVASAVFISGAGDVPAHISYEDILIGDVSINSRIDTTNKSFGTLLLSNDGEFNAWLDYYWRGYPLKVYFGDRSWSLSDFRVVFDGINGGINIPAANRLEWSIYDYSETLNVDVGSDAAPLCYGKVFNVEPILIDGALLKYKVHSGAVTSIVVRDNGVVIAPTPDLVNGEFTLIAQPAGRITADVVQVDQSAAQIVTALCTLTGISVDATNVDAFANTAALGIYINRATNLGQIIGEVLGSVGATSLFNNAGELQIYRLEAPTAPTLNLTADDIAQDGLRLQGIEQPSKSYTLGYRKNWAIQDKSSVASSLTAAQAEDIAKDYLKVTTENVLPNHPLAVDDKANTLIYTSADAQTECDRRALLRHDRRRIWTAKCYLSAAQITLGQTINITYPDFGFENGEDVVVIGIDRAINARTLELTLWH